MRILYVTSTDLSGATCSPGSVRHVMEVAENLVARGHRLTLLAPGVGRYPHPTPVDVRYVPAPKRRYARTLVPEALMPAYLVRHMARADAVYWRQAFLTAWPALAARAAGKPLVCEVNGLTEDEVYTEDIPALRRSVVLHLEKVNYRLADRLICVAPAIRDRILKSHPLNPDRVHVILNGVNANRMPVVDPAEAKAKVGVPPDAPVAGFVGHFFPWDGIETLIAAAPRVLEKFPRTRFLVVGSGPWGEHLPGLARETGVGANFVFPGRIAWEELYWWVNAFDAACAPYARSINTRSGRSSLKILEYFACQKPVVASRTTVIPEVADIEQKGLGLVVPPEDPEALAEALIDLFSHPEKRAAMGRGGREYVERERGWDKVAEKTEAVLRKALADKGRA